MKLAGFNSPTQDVSGASGSARNETITAWAQGDSGATTCPTPGMLMIVALDRFAAAAFAPASEVNVSKLPEMRSVGMLLATGWRMAAGAAGTEPEWLRRTVRIVRGGGWRLAFSQDVPQGRLAQWLAQH